MHEDRCAAKKREQQGPQQPAWEAGVRASVSLDFGAIVACFSFNLSK